jgi:hypothetical protein
MYNGWTESESNYKHRSACNKMGGYGWTPKTDDEREQVRLLQTITAEAHDEYFAELEAIEAEDELWRDEMNTREAVRP